MLDSEMVMSWLEGLAQPDWHKFHSDTEVQVIAESAIALLKDDETRIQYLKDYIAMCKEEVERLHKEQEAIKPKSKVRHGANAQIQHFCGNCNSMLHGKPKFCSECGKPVLWKGR